MILNKRIIALAALAVGALYSRGMYRWILNRALLKLVAKTTVHPPGQTLRTVARHIQFQSPEVVERPTYPHPNDAALRSATANWMIKVARDAGYQPYDISTSTAMRDRKVPGDRLPYFAKDLSTESLTEPLPKNPAFLLVDVDYYVDMPALLAGDLGFPPAPYLISTIVPTAACGRVSSESFYTWINDDTIRMTTGGTDYEHKLWHWHGDGFTVTSVDGSTVTYDMEVFRTAGMRAVVLLTPVARTPPTFWWKMGAACLAVPLLFRKRSGVVGLTALLACGIVDHAVSQVSSRELTRLSPGDGDFVALTIFAKSGPRISIAEKYGGASATVPLEPFSAIQSRIENSQASVNIGVVEATLTKMLGCPEQQAVAAPVLTRYLVTRKKKDPPSYSRVAPVPKVSYYTLNSLTTPEGKDGFAVPLMAPLMTGGFVPTDSLGSDIATVEQRVNAVKNDTEPPPVFTDFVEEFIQFLVPEDIAYTGAPDDNDHVVGDWKRPSQVALVARTLSWPWRATKKFSAFMKREVYGKTTPPRNITNVDGPEKPLIAAYVKAFTRHLKTIPCYAFREPAEVASQVALAAFNANFVLESDYSKFDGSISQFLRWIELRVLLRFFAPGHHKDINDLMKTLIWAKGVTKHGVAVDYGAGRLSGEPGTSAWNTVINMFVLYSAWRHTRINGEFVKPSVAWEKVTTQCITGGDDGLAFGLPERSMKWATRNLGLTAKCKVAVRGSTFTMLGRFFGPSTWFGDADTCCDVRRQLPKFHITFSKQPPFEVLLAKCQSVLHDDRNTPIIGPIAKVIEHRLRKSHVTPAKATRDVVGYTRSVSETAYPNSFSPWMVDTIGELTELEYTRIADWMESEEEDLGVWLARFPTIEGPPAEVPAGTLVGDVLI